MTSPVFVRIVRPYDTAAEYLAAEAGTIDRRGMLLVDAEPLPPGTLVRLSVCLSGGEPVIKAEGRVRRHRPSRDGRAGGLMVQFKRYGASTKLFIDEAVARRRTTDEGTEEDSSPSATDGQLEEPTSADDEREAADAPGDPGSSPRNEQRPLEPTPLPRSLRSARSSLDEIPAPSNRESLLEELRRRARTLSPDQVTELTTRGSRI